MSINFTDLTYDKFKDLAKNCSNDSHRVGFPEEYREGNSAIIVDDILSKLTNLKKEKINFLEIGSGWSQLTKSILDHCIAKSHNVVFVDSSEMLSLVPSHPCLYKLPGRFPTEVSKKLQEMPKFDAILAYSVIQYPFIEGSLHGFIDSACEFLNDGGQLLLGDIPNISMRKRFFASNNGQKCHQQYTGDPNSKMDVSFNCLEKAHIDDGVLIGIITRLRMAGYHAFLVPQGEKLPMTNRREDLLIINA